MLFGKTYFDTIYQKYELGYKYTQWKTLQPINLTDLCFSTLCQRIMKLCIQIFLNYLIKKTVLHVRVNC